MAIPEGKRRFGEISNHLRVNKWGDITSKLRLVIRHACDLELDENVISSSLESSFLTPHLLITTVFELLLWRCLAEWAPLSFFGPAFSSFVSSSWYRSGGFGVRPESVCSMYGTVGEDFFFFFAFAESPCTNDKNYKWEIIDHIY